MIDDDLEIVIALSTPSFQENQSAFLMREMIRSIIFSFDFARRQSTQTQFIYRNFQSLSKHIKDAADRDYKIIGNHVPIQKDQQLCVDSL